MRKTGLLVFYFFLFCICRAQPLLPPDRLYGQLFHDVQTSRIFADNKTFVDCLPKKDPKEILSDYLRIKSNPNLRFSLEVFVKENFFLPDTTSSGFTTTEIDLVTHIDTLWSLLKRKPKEKDTCSLYWCHGSLLPLPYAYIIPGGRFREIYYWDSYFTMLGLRESGRMDLVEDMIKNFAFLIRTYGHIPNGNRTYYLSRSQPPFFSLMVGLLSDGGRNQDVYRIFLPALEKEYDYWMDRSAPTKHVVRMPDGSLLNRYYDQLATPRPESYDEDVSVGSRIYPEHQAALYRDLRSAAESGWDFSSRWFNDGRTLNTIQTTSLVPVDLNCLLYQLEQTLSLAWKAKGNKVKAENFRILAEKRKKAINKYCWSPVSNWYVDYNLSLKKMSATRTLAGMYPFFFHLADAAKAAKAKPVYEKYFLKPGGAVTTVVQTGQQWDAPNGWAPLQWISVMGWENYGYVAMAKETANRWFRLNKKVFMQTGKLMEKYNVVETNLEAGGGEYPSQDGFGWTNGVLLALIKKYNFR
jgi:alpha,alpha-trehalase